MHSSNNKCFVDGNSNNPQHSTMIIKGCDIIKPKTVNKNRKFKCSSCNSFFPSNEELQKHRVEELACDQCKKKFCSKVNLKKHILTHSDTKSYCCEHCGLTFKSQAMRKSHQENVHESAPYSCHLCGKILKHKKYMKYHMYSHVQVCST